MCVSYLSFFGHLRISNRIFPFQFPNASHPSHHTTATPPNLSLQNSNKLLHDRITDLGRAGAAADVLGAHALVDARFDGGIDLTRQLGLLEAVLQHHAHGQDGRDRVDDALAGDVGGGAWCMALVLRFGFGLILVALLGLIVDLCEGVWTYRE